MESTNFQMIMLPVTFIFFLVALIWDLKFHKIPNKLCIVILFTGLGLQLFYHGIWNGLLNFTIGLTVAFSCLFPLFLIKALGGGDVKLMMALGTMFGAELTLWSIVLGIICGIFTSIFLTIRQVGIKGILSTFHRYYQILFCHTYFKPEDGEAAALRVPYAPALALGWLWACYLNDDVMMTISNLRYALSI
ncbi:prepilin peptidase [Thalassotalea crassostreae]|uniref:A24 family peptidase n=1 Tax=Thalassotalea crassostreae TaxID=1763536 RepID=UPI000839A8B2|nr:A24 family peptidase [Thalassotalea crassostreae]